MTDPNPRPVVVAVGYDLAESALAYGAAEAGRLGCGLHVVHAVHVVPSGPEMVLVETSDVDRIGRGTLTAALEHARSLVDTRVPVTGQVVHGPAVHAIVTAVPDARVIVLQRRPMSRLRRVVSRSVSSGVAARAHVPVVSVPGGWMPARDSAEPVVTVGVGDPDRSGPILAAAVAAARSRGATLHVLHIWWYPGVYDNIIAGRAEQEWSDRARVEMQAALDAIGTDGVKVVIEARQGFPAAALVDASHTSELVVVGRHDPLTPLGSHLGPVSRAVLHEAACPVLMADPRRHGEVSA